MLKQLLILVPFSLALAACSKPKLDTSTDEAMRRSTEEVRSSLPEEERDEFDEGLMLVMMSSLQLDSLSSASLEDVERGAEAAANEARTRLNGMSADEVLREADRIKAERERREREAALVEIRTLRQSRQRAQRDARNLAAFVITGARYYKDRDYFGMVEPVIRLTMTNNTEHPISRAYFRGVLQSPGRSVPWVEEDFNYSIEGGIEPEESKTISLAPNMFGEWGTTEAPGDAVLGVTVVKLDGADGQTLYDAEFSEHDEERLRELLLLHGQASAQDAG